jgi:hypothetical protein
MQISMWNDRSPTVLSHRGNRLAQTNPGHYRNWNDANHANVSSCFFEVISYALELRTCRPYRCVNRAELETVGMAGSDELAEIHC